MAYTKEQQEKYERIHGILKALTESNGAARGSRKTVDVHGTAVTAYRCAHNYTAFETELFSGSYAMSLLEVADYLATK